MNGSAKSLVRFIVLTVSAPLSSSLAELPFARVPPIHGLQRKVLRGVLDVVSQLHFAVAVLVGDCAVVQSFKGYFIRSSTEPPVPGPVKFLFPVPRALWIISLCVVSMMLLYTMWAN